MRLAIIGCGAVASVHATGLRRAGVPVDMVCDANLERARSFASAHGVPRAETDPGRALESADAVIVASPSPLHFEHALQALERRVHTLVEVPPCACAGQAGDLDRLAAREGMVVQCAHTSRYLEPYQKIGQWIREGRLGEILHVHYFRYIVPARREWTDDAWLHHAAHPMDLLLHWFGDLQPAGWVAIPRRGAYSDVNMLASLPNGAPASIAISYSAKRTQSQLSVIGEERTVVTDGFSFIDSSDRSLNWQGDATASYENAIAAQDREFLRCCETGTGGVPWSETMRMMRHMSAPTQGKACD